MRIGTVLSLVPASCALSNNLLDIANMALQNSPAATRLVTNKMCPFAQKAWIALECASTPYELEEISLYGRNGKPDWFLKLNPSGTVPVLVAGGGAMVLRDSDLILDAIENGQVGADNKLAPKELQSSIKQWRKDMNRLLPIGKSFVLSRRSLPQLQSILKNLDDRVVGPYLLGDAPTTADCHAFPFLWRLASEYSWMKDYRGLTEWLTVCESDKRFRKTIQSSWWWWW